MEPVVKPSKQAPEGTHPLSGPASPQECAMAELGIGEVAEPEIALHQLDDVEAGALAEAIREIVQRRKKLEAHEQQRKRAAGCGNAYEADSVGIWVVELDGEYCELMLLAQTIKQSTMTSPNGVRRDDQIIQDRDPHQSSILAVGSRQRRTSRQVTAGVVRVLLHLQHLRPATRGYSRAMMDMEAHYVEATDEGQ
jgi:hypothetical protein